MVGVVAALLLGSLGAPTASATTDAAGVGPVLGPGPGTASPSVRVSEVETPGVVVDPGYDGPTAPVRVRLADGTRVAAYPLASTFLLHSSPGSQRVLYLDFDGAPAIGSRWNVSGAQPGWSLDTDPELDDGEQTAIQDVWQQVAEDYAPFDVDVTTQEPPAAAITRSSIADQVYGTRVLLTGSRQLRSPADTALCGGNGGCGGVAFTGAFDTATDHDRVQPALVFPENLADDVKAMADAASHEAGHTLGLRHDGVVAANGQPAQEYHAGSGVWGPLMGAPHHTPLTQWSRGEYPGASRTEDDLSLISAGGAPRRGDLVGGTVATSTPLPGPTGTPEGTGTVESAGDVDVFALGECSGTVTVSASPAAAFSPDVDLSLTVMDRDSRVLGTSSPVATRVSRTVAAGLGASLRLDAGSGTVLYAAVDGTAGPGYPGYGSVGRYLLSATGCTPAGGGPGAPRSLTATHVGNPHGTVAVSWAPPSTGRPDVYTVTTSPGGQVVREPGTATGTALSGLEPGTTYRVSVTASDGGGASSGPATTSLLVPPLTPDAVATLSVAADAAGRADVSWTPPTRDGGAEVTGYRVRLGPVDQVFDQQVRGVTITGLAPATSYTAVLSAVNAAGAGPTRSQAFTVPGTADTSTPAPATARPGAGAGGQTSTGSRVLHPSAAPSRWGSATVGSRVGVRPGTWPAPVRMRYRWLLDGRVLRGVTGPTLRPPGSWAGRRLAVRVSVGAPGYVPVVRTLTWGRVRR